MLIIEIKTKFTFESIFSKTDNLLFRWRESSSFRKRDKKKKLKRVRFTTKFRQREFQQKKSLFYEKYRQKLFQQKSFYIFEKRTRIFRKKNFKSIFNHERIHDRSRTTNLYIDDSQFISKKKRRFQIVTKKKFFRRKYEYDSNYDRHDNWKKQFYRKIIFNLKSRHDFRWNNKLSYERNNSSDYQKKNSLKRREKNFRNYRDNFQHDHDDYFFLNEKKFFETIEIIDRFMINVSQDFVRLTSWNLIQILFSLRFLFEDFFK